MQKHHDRTNSTGTIIYVNVCNKFGGKHSRSTSSMCTLYNPTLYCEKTVAIPAVSTIKTPLVRDWKNSQDSFSSVLWIRNYLFPDPILAPDPTPVPYPDTDPDRIYPDEKNCSNTCLNNVGSGIVAQKVVISFFCFLPGKCYVVCENFCHSI